MEIVEKVDSCSVPALGTQRWTKFLPSWNPCSGRVKAHAQDGGSDGMGRQTTRWKQAHTVSERDKFQTKLSRKASLRKCVLSKDLKEMKELVMEELSRWREQLRTHAPLIVKSPNKVTLSWSIPGTRSEQYMMQEIACALVSCPLSSAWRMFTKIRIMIHSALKKYYCALNSNTVIGLIFHFVFP